MTTGAARSSSSPSSSAGTSCPRCSATSSTSTWLTRLDLPEPDTPVTVVNTPSGKRIEPTQIVARDPGKRSQPFGGARRPLRGSLLLAKNITSRLRRFDFRKPLRRPAIKHIAAVLASAGPDIDDPIRMTNHI